MFLLLVRISVFLQQLTVAAERRVFINFYSQGLMKDNIVTVMELFKAICLKIQNISQNVMVGSRILQFFNWFFQGPV